MVASPTFLQCLASVAWVCTRSSEGNSIKRFQLSCGLCDQGADLPVACVESKCDGAAVFSAQATVCTEDENFGV
jgi:hypothetical protein